MNVIPFIQGEDIPKILKLCLLQISLKSNKIETEFITRDLGYRYDKVKVTIEVNKGDNMDARRWETQLLN